MEACTVKLWHKGEIDYILIDEKRATENEKLIAPVFKGKEIHILSRGGNGLFLNGAE